MPTLPFTFAITEGGFDLVSDIEVELDCSVELIGGEPDLTVTAIRMEGYRYERGFIVERKTFNLLDSDNATTGRLARDIIAATQEDENFLAIACEAECISFTSRNGNDPEGMWRPA